MKPFLVEMRTTIVVMAEDATDAMRVANDTAADACRDQYPKATRSEPITRFSDLREGWDADCIPYGGDGNTRLRMLIPI